MSSEDTKELAFERTDGDENLWPSNTKRLVDSEGHVNYMQPVELNDDWSVRWRKSIGSAFATLMKLPGEWSLSMHTCRPFDAFVYWYTAGPEYILKDWPPGYCMFIHYKGPQDNPRTDKYLIGTSYRIPSRSSSKFTYKIQGRITLHVFVPSQNSSLMPCGL
jgi:Transcription-silencing protein, cryptic loci regulator Clr2